MNKLIDLPRATDLKCSLKRPRLNELPPNDELTAPPPAGSFVMDVMDNGVHTPIKVIRGDGGYKKVVDGRRRLMAARLCVEKGSTSHDRILAIVYDDIPGILQYLIQESSNIQRSNNLLSTIEAVRELLLELMDYKVVAERLHVPVSYVKDIDSKYGLLDAYFIRAIGEGNLAPGVAIDLAKHLKKFPGNKKKLVKILDDEGKITGTDIKNARQVSTTKSMKKLALPDMSIPGEMDEVEAPMYTGLDEAGKLMDPVESPDLLKGAGRLYRLIPFNP